MDSFFACFIFLLKNAKTFGFKRKDVLSKTHRRLKESAKAFGFKRKGVLHALQKAGQKGFLRPLKGGLFLLSSFFY